MKFGPGCGACSLCCTLLNVPDIKKPAGMRCWHTTVHGGCARHAEKDSAPELEACATFKCQWLISATQDPENTTRELRPDICHVIFGPRHPEDETVMFVQVKPDHPNAWRVGEPALMIEKYLAAGATLEIIVGEERFRLPDEAYSSQTELGIPSS